MSKFKRSMLAASVGICCVGPVLGESITLEEAGQRMLAYSQQFQILELERDAAIEQTRAALGERFPRVQLSVGYMEIEQDIVSSDNTTFQAGTSEYPTTTTTLSIVQPIFDAERFRQYPLAKAEEQAAVMRREVQLNQLWSQLIEAFLLAAEMQNQLEQQRLIADARESLWEDAQSLLSAGRIEAAQALGFQSEWLAAQSQALIVRQQQAEALDALMQWTGPGISQVQAAIQPQQLPDLERLSVLLPKDRLLALNPAVQLAEAEMLVAEKQLRLVKGAHFPKVNFRIQAEQEATEGSLFGGGSEVESIEYGVDITWLMYQGGTAAARSRESTRRLMIAGEQRQETIQSVERRYDELFSTLRHQQRVLNALAQEYQLAEERVEAAQQQVDSGRAGLGVLEEAALRRDTLKLRQRQQALVFLKAQVELYALFGAQDISGLNAALRGRPVRLSENSMTPSS